MGKLRIKKFSRVHLKAARFKQNDSISINSDLLNTNNKKNVLKPASFDPFNTSNDQNNLKDEEWTVVKTSRSKSIIPQKDHQKKSKSELFLTQRLLNDSHGTTVNNPFSGINIKSDLLLKQTLNYNETEKSEDEPKPIKPKKKRDRIQLRREHLLKKLEVKAAIKAQEEKAEKRAKTPVVGDLNFLKLSLPDLSTNPKSKKKKQKKSLKSKTDKKMRKQSRKKAYKGLAEVLEFQNNLKNSSGKSKMDIRNMIMENIKNHC